MKKLMSLILALVMCLTLAGCGGDGASRETFDVTKFPENQELSLDAKKDEIFQAAGISEEDVDYDYGFDYKNPQTVNLEDVECLVYYIFYSDDKPSCILYDAKATDDNYNKIEKFFEENYGGLGEFDEKDYPNASLSFRVEDNLDVRVIKGEDYDWCVYAFRNDDAVRFIISRITTM